MRRKICSSKVSVAADYSDSVPESSNHVRNNGYHPLEELKDQKRVRETKLTYAEIAKTTLEANSSALLIFPGTVHREPHEHISWAEYQYVIDEYGDIFFEIPDDENILQDPGASNPVNIMIGMDIPLIEKRRLAVAEHSLSESGSNDSFLFNDNYFEVGGSDMFEWGMLDTTSSVHPIYFAKCMTKAINMQYAVKMDHPSNGVSILGCLRPAFFDEQSYLRRIFNHGESDGYHLDWNDEDLSFGSDGGENCSDSTIYRLEIMRVELFSVYGVQSAISLQDFRDADPDILVDSTPEIIERFCEKRARADLALRDLCKKNGLSVEDASLIGVDSLGMDVRVFTGLEVQTHRFPFKVRATSGAAAEKQIQQLLFPRSRRKKGQGSQR